jgi:hypothetical protein
MVSHSGKKKKYRKGKRVKKMILKKLQLQKMEQINCLMKINLECKCLEKTSTTLFLPFSEL